MSGISQSLYATAAGLFVAIPAVVAFNILSQKLKTLIAESDALKDAIAARSPGAGA
jgi:biopolymer transport protein ExbB/TolQ